MKASDQLVLAMTFFGLGAAHLGGSPFLAGLGCMAAALHFGADPIRETWGLIRAVLGRK